MNIKPSFPAFSPAHNLSIPRQYVSNQIASAADNRGATSVTISQAARDALTASNASSSSSSAAENADKSIEARLAEIKTKGPVNRSKEDHDFLFANDKRLAEITALIKGVRALLILPEGEGVFQQAIKH